METLQAVLTAFQQQNMDNINRLITEQTRIMDNVITIVTRKPTVDTRGLGRPDTFKGDEAQWMEWKTKMLAYLCASNPGARTWVDWASRQTEVITKEDVELEYDDDLVRTQVASFDLTLYQTLVCSTSGHAFNMVHSAGGSGLEAVRLLSRRYEPRTPGTKRAILKAILGYAPAKRIEDIERSLLSFEELLKRYDALSGAALPEDLQVTIALDLCTKDLREHLEITTKEKSYREVREEIMSYVERKRESFSNGIKAMEVDNAESAHNLDVTWWGGGDDAGQWLPFQNESCHDSYYSNESVDYVNTKGGKKGFGKGFGKGKGWADKGKGKGLTGGEKGEGKGGKGGKGGFQGHCHWCGEWGHSQSRCRWKDEYMDSVRRARGGKPTAHNLEENDGEHQRTESRTDLENLETRRGGCTAWAPLCSLETNRFAPLATVDEEDYPDIHQANPGFWVEDQQLKKNKAARCGMKRSNKHWEARTTNKSGELGSLYEQSGQELSSVSFEGTKADMWITIDSGASENVIGESMASQFTTRPSRGSREGMTYVTANGSVMPNRGEKEVKVVTSEGNRCALKMQVTDVQKPLMSVAKICDAGHKVTFTKKGGIILNEGTGVQTSFDRVDNVYRLRVQLAPEAPDFTRQER